MIKKLVFLFVLCSLLVLSCDLFTGPKVDLFRAISDEADWANAPKLTVRIEYPSMWGTSNPVQGTIAMDIRKGFPFGVEFVTGNSYTLQSWQAYRTSDLESLGNWLDFPALITPEKIQALGPGDITLPAPVAAGGTFKFTIHTTDPVTIIPWCDNQPRIVRTEPRDNPDGQPYSIASDIVLYFNCAFNIDTAKFASAENADGIWITAKYGNNTPVSVNNFFYEPEYAAVDGFFTITIKPRSDKPLEKDGLITVTVKGIANEKSGIKDEKGYSFSWKTKEGVRITSWSATNYDNVLNKSHFINISANTDIKDDEWKDNESGKYYLKLKYRQNGGPEILLFIGNKDVFTKWSWQKDDYGDQYIGAINNIPLPDYTGVREGRQISGIREYTIIIEIYEGKIEVDEWGNLSKIINEGIIENKVSFKIWNIPNMRVSNSSPAVEVRTAAELAAMKNNLGGQYVLANDIFISERWTPVGRYENQNPDMAFHGKFYGNGHTITINNGFNAGDNAAGLFGRVANKKRFVGLGYADVDWVNSWSVIMDLNLILGGDTYNSAALSFGGVAGTICGTPVNRGNGGWSYEIYGVEIRNVITRGTIKVGFNERPEDKYKQLGGIAGYLEGYITVANCLSAANIDLLFDQGRGNTYIGGIAGRSSGESILSVENIHCSGQIDSISLESWVYTSFGPSMAASVTVGGVIGEISGTRVTNAVMSGNLNITKTTAKYIRVGGIVGNVANDSESFSIYESWVSGNSSINIPEPPKELTNHLSVCVGGVVGEITSYGDTISRCYSNAKILVGNFAPIPVSENVYVGGFAGRIENNNNLEKCYSSVPGYNDFYVSVEKSANVYVGGLVGSVKSTTIKNCYALGGVYVERVNNGNGNIYAGGVVGYMENYNVENNFSYGRVEASIESTSALVYAGGIVGYNNSGTLKNNAALGLKVVVKGGNTSSSSAKRIYGYPSSSSEANNYAINTMISGTALFGGVDPETSSSSTNAAAQDGKSAEFKDFRKIDIWIDNDKLNFNSGEYIWDFSSLSGLGYPKLAGLGGQ